MEDVISTICDFCILATPNKVCRCHYNQSNLLISVPRTRCRYMTISMTVSLFHPSAHSVSVSADRLITKVLNGDNSAKFVVWSYLKVKTL